MEDSSITFSVKEPLNDKEYMYICNVFQELFPPPKVAYITRTKEVEKIEVDSYLDDKILNAFKKVKNGIEFRISEDLNSPVINFDKINGFVFIPLIKKDGYKLAKEIALRLVENLNLKKLKVSPVDFRSFHRKYRKNQRTIDFPGLYWLQYYDAEEFKKQGGKAIVDNPYIEAQLIKDGIFIEVGKSPYDVHTPEGEELMIKANAAMPPVVED